MKVLLLGGTGIFGKRTAALLTSEGLITEIGIASRNLEIAQGVADETGYKAHAVQCDIRDPLQLSAVAAGYDIIVNTAGPASEVQVPALQAAIEAGIHYCDLAAIGKYARCALMLDPQARDRGITAVIASGWVGTTSLMAVYAARQLDETEQMSVCWLFDHSPGDYFSPEQCLVRVRETGKVETSWDLIETAAGPTQAYRTGIWVTLDPLENSMEVIHPSGSRITAYPADSPSIYTLPHYLPGVRTVNCLLGMIPPQLMELFILKSQRISRGETDWMGAAMDHFETASMDKERWLVSPPGYTSGWGMWVVAEGRKAGRKARFLCWPSFILDWTTVPLLVTTLRLLRGEVSQYGVLPTEACFDLESFLDEAAKYVKEEFCGEPLLNEMFEWVEEWPNP